jgi:hypothetical protein
MSSTFTKLPCSDRLCTALRSDARCATGDAECDYRYSYCLGDDGHPDYTHGFLGSETFTLGGDAVPGVGFSYATTSEGNYGEGSGLVGLGRGPLSLVSQLDAGTFMYCLTRDASKASPLLFGAPATMTGALLQKKSFARRFEIFFGGRQHFQPPRLMSRINRDGYKKPSRKIDLRRRAS